MPIQIIHKRSEIAGAAPAITDLVDGEFGVNGADGDVFFRILIDPAGDNVPSNQRILSVRRPKNADGGEITFCGDFAQFFDLLTAAGDSLVDSNGNSIGFRRCCTATQFFDLLTAGGAELVDSSGKNVGFRQCCTAEQIFELLTASGGILTDSNGNAIVFRRCGDLTQFFELITAAGAILTDSNGNTIGFR